MRLVSLVLALTLCELPAAAQAGKQGQKKAADPEAPVVVNLGPTGGVAVLLGKLQILGHHAAAAKGCAIDGRDLISRQGKHRE